MSNNNSIAGAIQVIHDSELLGQKFKIYGTFEEPLFLAKDVAEWIEHADVTSMLRSVDENEKVLRSLSGVPGSSGGNPNKWFLTESGLYEVLMLSRKPIAKQFKREVKRILHEIRTTGGYVQPELPEKRYLPLPPDEKPDFIGKLFFGNGYTPGFYLTYLMMLNWYTLDECQMREIVLQMERFTGARCRKLPCLEGSISAASAAARTAEVFGHMKELLFKTVAPGSGSEERIPLRMPAALSDEILHPVQPPPLVGLKSVEMSYPPRRIK